MDINKLEQESCAGIVTYNPDIERLQSNVEAVKRNNIETIIIVDNGSKNIAELEKSINAYGRMRLIKNVENKGIAHALNQIFETACTIGVKWVLTLDQDSVINDDMMQVYGRYFETGKNIASITSIRHDRAYSKMQDHDNTPTEYVNRCITSGNLVQVDAWSAVHGFDNRLFIDMVDYDFCYRLREKGYKILRINQPCILHELGKPTVVKFMGKERFVYNHNAFRKYYIFRNYIYTLRNYGQFAKQYDSYSFLVRLFIKTLLYEKEDKWIKLREMISGVHDGFKLKRIDL